MRTTEISYPSADGASTVRAWLWMPDALPDDGVRGLIQLVHGMSEHAGRYRAFASFLCDAGFAVCANDHVGHGKTAADEGELGHIPAHGGEEVLIRDIHVLRMNAIARLGMAVPYVIFGHSMGSFIVRIYLTRYAYGVRGAVVCGTGQQTAALTGAGQVLCGGFSALKGERYRSPLAQSMGVGGFARSVKHARTDADWLSHDEGVVDAYLADPLSGKQFTVGGFITLARLAADARSSRLACRIPHVLPMLFISGEQDPVGEFGRGVVRAVEEYRRAGLEHVELILYPDARHEILNEPAVRDRVMADVLSWIGHLGL